MMNLSELVPESKHIYVTPLTVYLRLVGGVK